MGKRRGSDKGKASGELRIKNVELRMKTRMEDFIRSSGYRKLAINGNMERW
jgi:hypothetical protein